MKVKLLAILTVLVLFCLSFNNVFADENIDMSEWRFIELDGNGDHTISMFYSKNDPDKYAFCIEPGISFNKLQPYSKQLNTDDYIFNLVKAYDKYGKDIDNTDYKYNYYCATQLLIWEHITGETYEFNKDYSEYEEEILDYMEIMDKPLLMMTSFNSNVYESEVGETITIENDYSDYEVTADEGIEIINNDENGLSYQLTDDEPEYKSIELSPKYNPKDYSYSYVSSNSQNLYCFEGTYEQPRPVFLSLFALAPSPSYTDIYYSKKDTNNNPIAGAEFTLYELNNANADSEITFIQTYTDINLYEVLLDDYSIYDELMIELSERYQPYLDGSIINTNEVGYFPYKIYNNDSLIKEGRCYVSDDISQTNGTYNNIDVLSVFKGYSEAIDVNTINDIETNKQYYLCESEPKNGYIYVHNACKLVDTSTYDGEVLDYINDTRTYTLKLMKQSPYEVLLDGAKFKITYLDNNEYKDIILTTGYLSIDRKNNYNYLIYKHENDAQATVIAFEGDSYSTNNVTDGKYYYYQSNDSNIDYSLLNNDYVRVVKGGISIDNLPYSSSLTIEELQAPQGFMITEPIYNISPNIAYSEITFRNFRVNEFNILPKKKFKVPKTCIES